MCVCVSVFVVTDNSKLMNKEHARIRSYLLIITLKNPANQSSGGKMSDLLSILQHVQNIKMVKIIFK